MSTQGRMVFRGSWDKGDLPLPGEQSLNLGGCDVNVLRETIVKAVIPLGYRGLVWEAPK